MFGVSIQIIIGLACPYNVNPSTTSVVTPRSTEPEGESVLVALIP